MPPSYGGGRYYGGGSTSAYSAGSRSPRGVAPYFLGGAALGIFPGLWLYGAYAYPYSHPYNYRNQTAANSTNPNGTTESLPVQCLCEQYSACGCDDNDNSTFIDSVIGNGSAADMNSSLVQIAPVNGTKTLIINGTLPNDTTNAGVQSDPSSAASGFKQAVLEHSGYWLMVATVASTVWLI